MNISIKHVNIDQVAETIFSIVKRTFDREFDLPTESTEEVKHYLKESETYMVYDDELPVGYFDFKEQEDGTIELKSIALLPTHQSQGIGKQMLTKVFQLTEGKVLSLVVHPRNSHALMTYLKNGFVIVGWKENYFGDGQPRLAMERKPQ